MSLHEVMVNNRDLFRQAIAETDADEDLLFAGLELDPVVLLSAYFSGVFPMGLGEDGAGPYGWFSPNPRGIVGDCQAHVSRTVRKKLDRFAITVDTCFEDVLRACGSPERAGRWITEDIIAAYVELHESGWAHSIEVWQGSELVGGLYGVALGGLFAGESMFHRTTDASKVAVAATAHIVATSTNPVFDVQWQTEHLRTLGVTEVARSDYLDMVDLACGSAGPQWAHWVQGGPWSLAWDVGSLRFSTTQKTQ